ncbi:MAG: hypothetical protein GY758_05150 [Fuerstiella sp.]|nr:hypothetical protein [Fuerstiella sp.]MCP4507431.1 hypothetical protein [Fuerstiella sp.]
MKSQQQRRAALAKGIIERCIEDLSWRHASDPDTTHLQQYASERPRHVPEYFEECARKRDYHHYAGPLTEDAVLGSAGLLLQSATMMYTFSSMGELAEDSPDVAAMIAAS